MARKGMKVTTTVSFQITFALPKGMNIPDARERIKDALIECGNLNLQYPTDIKVHLTNKEIKYGA